MVRKDRLHKDGGGLLMYIRKGLDFGHRRDLEMDTVEVIWIEIKLSNKPILLSLVYRPPNADSISTHNWLASMEEMLIHAYSENKAIVLTGDFNIDLLKPDLHNANRHNAILLAFDVQVRQISTIEVL